MSKAYRTALSDTLNFEPIDGEFVQILNCDRKCFHCWMPKVNIFDSMRIGEIPLSTKVAIALIATKIRCQ